MKYGIVLAGLLLAGEAAAQVPGTDVWIMDVSDGVVGSPGNATDRPGYDNQPSFLPDGSAFRYTRIDESGQADIWIHDFESGPRRLTDSATSEYSATPIPGSERFSVVVVEPDSTQRLWSLAPDGSDARLVIEDVAPVGYHAWGEEGELLLFVLGEPHELHRARADAGGSRAVARDIGRCLARIPGQDAWSFPLADEDDGWAFMRLDRATGTITRIAPAPAPEVQDYCWTPAGELWSSDGTSLLVWRDGAWRPLRDLSGDGLSGITRMSMSPDGRRLAVVASDPAVSP